MKDVSSSRHCKGQDKPMQRLLMRSRAAQASHASLADRVGYMEQRMGDSFAKHAQATGVGQPVNRGFDLDFHTIHEVLQKYI